MAYWSDEDNNRLLSLRSSGLRWVDLAKEFGRHRSAVRLQHVRISETQEQRAARLEIKSISQRRAYAANRAKTQIRQGFWTEERVSILTRMISSGYSASLIAAEVGATRSAVIAKSHRLDLVNPNARRVPEINKAPRVRRYFRDPSAPIPFKRPKPEPEVIKLRCDAIEPRHLSLADLERTACRYPYGDGPFTFCAHPRAEGSSYCSAHYDLTRGYDKRQMVAA